MSEFESLEPAVDPGNRISFLLDWELTMKCNLDCSYCDTGLYGGHDNSIQHPDLAQCLDTIAFMLEYVDLYMQHKPRGIRYVILNVYGGESLHHPHIVSILKQVHQTYQQNYQHRWHLTVTTTTNAVISSKKLHSILPFIDEFTVSYHSENTPKQKQLFKSNIKDIVVHGNRLKCVVLMHAQPDLFQDAQAMIEWCKENQIKFLPRQLDRHITQVKFNYLPNQTAWFDTLYKSKSYHAKKHIDIQSGQRTTDLSNIGRACCGGRSMCKDQSYKNRDFFVENRFPDWFCSVNEFFLYIKQVNGEIYSNKDCKMNFDNEIGPVGYLSDTKSLLDFTRTNLNNRSMPVVQCKKSQCWCGLCAPKARQKNTFDGIMEKYRT